MPKKRKKNRKKRLIITAILFAVLGILVFIAINLKENIKQVINPDYVFGIDISHHQGDINWKKVAQSHHPIDFVFVRATAGKKTDRKFQKNWEKVYEYGYIRGAYHYFQPHIKAEEQFKLFSQKVLLKTGDLPPVLDVEYKGNKPIKDYRKEVLEWLKLAEKHYDIKPIVYTGFNFYNKFLKGYINNYPLWIAHYSGKKKLKNLNWTFHQLSDKVRISGIKGRVDGDDFNGTIYELENMCVK